MPCSIASIKPEPSRLLSYHPSLMADSNYEPEAEEPEFELCMEEMDDDDLLSKQP